MLFDTAGVDCLVIRENEIGVYDTLQIKAVCIITNGNRIYIKCKDGTDLWLTMPKERIEENARSD